MDCRSVLTDCRVALGDMYTESMYSQFTITHRLRVDNLVVEVRDYEREQDEEFEVALPHFGLACTPDPTSRTPAAYWRLPSCDEWIPQRQIGVIPAELPIRVRVPKGHNKTLVCLATDQQADERWSPGVVAATLRITHAETYRVANALLRELEDDRLARREMVASLGKLLILQVGRQLGSHEPERSHTLIPWRMRKIEDAIRQAADGADLDLESLADQCRMSRKYLLSQFHQATGHSLKDYLWSAKADRAKLLIEQGQSFGTIARKLNFTGASHFSRSFSRYTGLTPSEYRRQAKNLSRPH